jgi:PAS domain S-box-containing protein
VKEHKVAVSSAKTIRVFFGIIASAMAFAALIDVLAHGHLSWISPSALLAFIAVLVAFVLHSLHSTRERHILIRQREAERRSASARINRSLGAVAAATGMLGQSEARYKGLVDAQGDPIYRRDSQNRLTFANDAFFAIFSLSSQDAIGRPFTPELHPDRRSPMFGSFAGHDAGRARVRYDQHVKTAFGWRWIAWEDYAVRDHDGHLIEVQSVGRDITERKALEDALTDARDKAEAASRAKSGFLATTSHEIRTPMNGVLGMARLLQETELRPDQRTYVDAIQHSGETLLTLIADLLDFSKIESGALSLDDDDVHVRAALESVVELLGPRAHAKNIEIIAVVTPEVPEVVRADDVRLRQILTNLIGNAVKFTEVGGVRIDASLARANGSSFIRFEVRDTGVGVPVEKRSDVFREFVQADSKQTRKNAGTGLGLAISKKLVEAMGGQIGLEATQEGGSMFWFTLPMVQIEAGTQQGEPLAQFTAAIVTRNAVLGEGLAAQIHWAGGKTSGLHPFDDTQDERFGVALIDAGTDMEPDLPIRPRVPMPSFLLITPAMRSRLSDLGAMGFAGYLVKPVRQSSLVAQLQRYGAPKQPEDSDAPFPPAVVDAGMVVPDCPGEGLSILIAEDNPVNMLLTRELLRRRGHRVTEVTSGEAAFAAMKTGRFDLMFTDIHMPGMDGIETTRAIRAHEAENATARTPIVALTADVLETGRRACQDAGMDDFLTKPIDPSELDHMIQSLFPCKDSPSQTVAA